jgi:hypothetical protein
VLKLAELDQYFAVETRTDPENRAAYQLIE